MFVIKGIRLVHKINNDFSKRFASNVAFIGLGNMGSKMAANLIKKGETLKIYDVVASSARNITGAQICSSPAEAATDASIVITMLPNGDAVKEAVLGENGILSNVAENAILVDCSTIEPKVAQDLSKIAKERKVKFLDAPVSGGVTGASAATLTFMVGGSKEDIPFVEPLLLKMGTKVLHCGKAGAGQIAKLCNNLILGATMIATAEGMNLGIKLGLDPKVLASVINTSSGRSWSSDIYNPVPGVIDGVPSAKNYEGGFMTRLMAKDLALAESAATSCDASVPLTALSHQIYRLMITKGFDKKDFSSVYKFFQEPPHKPE